MTTQHPDGVIEFRFYRPQVDRVCVVGDFNSWSPSATVMVPDGQGWWSCLIRLSPGVYQFRYFAEGRWFLDYAAFGLERGPLGWNSVLNVTPAGQSGAVAECRRSGVLNLS
jgi:1,4-alpha-glucan branching enzyme